MKWLDNKEFPGYQVSDSGLVRNSRGKILKPYDNGNGYLKITLMRDGKKHRQFIHRLVGHAFVPGYKPGYTIQHINHDRTCNEKFNLCWMSLEDNIKEMHEYIKGGN